jgi:hypothetical protein
VLFSIFGILATFGPALYYEISYRTSQARGIKYVVSEKPKVQNPSKPSQTISSTGVDNFAQVLTGAKQQVLVPKDTSFSIVIPKIGASAKVFPNIDASNPDKFLPIYNARSCACKGLGFSQP